MPGIESLTQLLPSAEIGTAHMENPMGIRKTIASGLIIAANAVTKDRTKENIAAEVKVLRRKLARFIEPKG
jgi:hypothetical protein